MSTVAIPNINFRVWTHKIEFPLGNLLQSLTQPEITNQRPSKFTDIEKYRINNEISRIECVEYNTDTGLNVMNADDIEYPGFN